jgi:hypothetical protein
MTTIVAAAVSGVAVVLSALVLRKSQQIHVLVNSRTDALKDEIADLKEQRDIRQQADDAAGPAGPGK